jgi:hypothetical protein
MPKQKSWTEMVPIWSGGQPLRERRVGLIHAMLKKYSPVDVAELSNAGIYGS